MVRRRRTTVTSDPGAAWNNGKEGGAQVERGAQFPNEAEPAMEVVMADVLSDRELALVDAYWRAANYVSVGQIYLLDNPLLREPLQLRHVKPRLLGHWGTTPGLNFVYVHLNRVIRKFDLDTLYVCGPGHGGPAMVANTYLEGTYTEV
jgi:xylulose-5-phosphate/fructose-6-phosphate phosphoketolase